jgi:hypothetical protein
MSLSEPTEAIWKQCDSYVAVALKHLYLGIAQHGPLPDRSGPATFDKTPERLRLNFLFPFIPERAVKALLKLRRSRWLYRAVDQIDESTATARSAHSAEQVEAMFEQAKAEIQKHLPAFSKVQQEIIRVKFLTIGPE